MVDLSAYSVGWTVSTGGVHAQCKKFVMRHLQEVPTDSFIGQEPPVSLPADAQAVFIPRMFPLPSLHGLAVSQLYDPLLGTNDFFDAVMEQAMDASPEVQSSLHWMSVFTPLQAWLDAVRADLAAFAIPLVA
jgi:hypothetical protein